MADSTDKSGQIADAIKGAMPQASKPAAGRPGAVAKPQGDTTEIVLKELAKMGEPMPNIKAWDYQA